MKKKGQNEGTIRKRKDGRWEARCVIARLPNGKQKFKYVYGKTRTEVANELAKILADLADGTYVNETNIELIDWFNDWLIKYAKPNIKLSTYTSYETYVRGHLKPYFRHIKLKDLTADRLQMFLNTKLENGRLDNKEGGLSPKTIKSMANMIHASLKQAYMNGLISKNISEFVKTPKIDKKEMRVLNRDEQDILISVARNYRLGIVVILDLFTGMRLGEILALRWEDIDFANNKIWVRNSLKRLSTHVNGISKTEMVLDVPKTTNSIRSIPLIADMVKELKTHQKAQQKEIEVADSSYTNKDFVFCNELGFPYDQATFRDTYYKMLVEAGLVTKKPPEIRNKRKKNIKGTIRDKTSLPPVTFHTLRHTFATRCLEQGLELAVLSKILGHADISTILNRYCHALPDRARENMEKIACLYKK